MAEETRDMADRIGLRASTSSGATAPAVLALLAVAGLTLAGCNPPHPKPKPPLHAVSALDCPDSEGDLTRKSAAADGKSCVYGTDGGDQVTLRLVSLDGKDASTVLDPIETELKSELPGATTDESNPPTPASPPNAPGAPDKDRVDIDLPGIHIHGASDGRTNVDTAGVHVEAHDGAGRSGDHAVVRIGGSGANGVSVNANDQGAQIRVHESGPGVRATYILASETPGPHGYRAAGYEARGPAGGPIVVATIYAKTGDHDDIQRDVRDLLRHNVGG
jgi:hypothetical protein